MSSTWVGGEAGVDPGVLLLHLLHDQDGLARAHGADDHLPLVRGRLHHLLPVLALLQQFLAIFVLQQHPVLLPRYHRVFLTSSTSYSARERNGGAFLSHCDGFHFRLST